MMSLIKLMLDDEAKIPSYMVVDYLPDFVLAIAEISLTSTRIEELANLLILNFGKAYYTRRWKYARAFHRLLEEAHEMGPIFQEGITRAVEHDTDLLDFFGLVVSRDALGRKSCLEAFAQVWFQALGHYQTLVADLIRNEALYGKDTAQTLVSALTAEEGLQVLANLKKLAEALVSKASVTEVTPFFRPLIRSARQHLLGGYALAPPILGTLAVVAAQTSVSLDVRGDPLFYLDLVAHLGTQSCPEGLLDFLVQSLNSLRGHHLEVLKVLQAGLASPLIQESPKNLEHAHLCLKFMESRATQDYSSLGPIFQKYLELPVQGSDIRTREGLSLPGLIRRVTSLFARLRPRPQLAVPALTHGYRSPPGCLQIGGDPMAPGFPLKVLIESLLPLESLNS